MAFGPLRVYIFLSTPSLIVWILISHSFAPCVLETSAFDPLETWMVQVHKHHSLWRGCQGGGAQANVKPPVELVARRVHWRCVRKVKITWHRHRRQNAKNAWTLVAGSWPMRTRTKSKPASWARSTEPWHEMNLWILIDFWRDPYFMAYLKTPLSNWVFVKSQQQISPRFGSRAELDVFVCSLVGRLDVFSSSTSSWIWFLLLNYFCTDCTMGFITMEKPPIWENMFGSLFPSI